MDLGCHSRKVSTTSKEAQQCFDTGLIQMFGFNHEDAIRWFQKALSIDPTLAIAHWAISHSTGLNYNNPLGLDRQQAYKHAIQAQQLSHKATPEEKALINALQCRYPLEEHQDTHLSQKSLLKKNTELERLFANAMRDVYKEFPHDSDIAAIFAESLMNLRPWKLWNPDTSGQVSEETYEIKKVLETALSEYPLHPGLLHFYIHLMELSPMPEEAIDVADRLRNLVPDQGHLLHMPSHIDMWRGHYEQAILANENAIRADQKYVNVVGIETEFYKMYRLHNIHFCCWACMFDGQYEKALKNARMMQDELTPELVIAAPGAEILEGFFCIVWHVFIRFGKWEEILQEPIPGDESVYPMGIVTAYYARGIAYASMGMIEEAESEKEKFIASLKNPLLPKRIMINNYVYKGDKGIFHIARFMLFGEIEYRKGNFEDAFDYLRKAVEFNDNLVYDEPWGWMVPPRHALGALLLEQERYEEAASVYLRDLETYRNNLWSLSGLVKCMENIPSSDLKQLASLQCKLSCASHRADIIVSASCFCSVAAGAKPATKQ